MHQGPPRQLSRRRLLARGMALGAGSLAAAAAGAGSATAAPPSGKSAPDLMRSIMSVELLAVFAYHQILGSNQLSDAAALVVNRFLAHEQRHVSLIGGQLDRLGILPPSPVSGVSAAEQVLSSHGSSAVLQNLHSEKDCLTVLQQVESVAEGAYYQALLAISDPGFIAAALQIMPAEAQHWTVLTELKFPGMIDFAVPYAYVEGTYR
jgi:Ferritin-like domain